MSWKDRFTYQEKAFVEHAVGGNTLRFFPNRLALLRELAEVSKPVAKAIGQLFADQRNDATAVTERFTEKDSSMERITVEAITPEISTHRRKEREDAIDALVDALSDGRNRILLGRLLMDSLREEFPFKKDRPVPEVEEFLDGDGLEGSYAGLDLPLLRDCLEGWLRANAKVFGAAGEKMAGLVKGRLEQLQVDSPSTEENPASGSSSKTRSSLQLVTDSPSIS